MEQEFELQEDITVSEVTLTLEANNSELLEETSQNVESNSKSSDRPLRLPIARIRHIMKMDSEFDCITSYEAACLITKATEIFLESLSKEVYVHTKRAKRKTVQKKDLEAAIESADSLCFLESMLDN